MKLSRVNKHILITTCIIISVLLLSILVYFSFVPKHVKFTVTMQQYNDVEHLDNYADATIDIQYYPIIPFPGNEVKVKGTLEINGVTYSTYVRPNSLSKINVTPEWRKKIHWNPNYLDLITFYDESYPYAVKFNYFTARFNIAADLDAIFLIISNNETNFTEYWSAEISKLPPDTRKTICQILRIKESDIGSYLREHPIPEAN
ncbi:MAG: hypothetical protein HFE63_00300 [Clostridiales bacterium]|nr:hypothetical protein [Clostridiales bacterium]